MLVVCVFSCWVLMLPRPGMSLPQQTAEKDSPPGQKQVPATDHPTTGNRRWSNPVTDSTQNGNGLGVQGAGDTISSKETSDAIISHHHPGNAPCLRGSQGDGEILEDILVWLRESWGNESAVTSDALTRFGVCSNSDGSPVAALTDLAEAANRGDKHGVDVLHPIKELLADEEEEGRLILTLDPPQSPLLNLKPILLLAFGSPLRVRNLGITFTSQFLNPNTQTTCISEGTQYIMLTGKASEDNSHEKWRLSVETKTPDTGQMLQEILIGEGPGSNISMTPLLLFLLERGTNVRLTQVPGSSLASSETFSFLVELQKFLGDVLPQSHPQSTPVQLDSLHSLPPLTLGLSSSETLLIGLLNSSAPTLFSFPMQSSLLQAHRGELSLAPVLLEVLRLKLEETMSQIREEEVGYRGMERLRRLKALSALSTEQEEPLAGSSNPRETQYRAFLLLKALQTVARAFEVERGQRAARGGQDGPGRGLPCRLYSLTVSLERYLVGPTTATINNCHGVCGFPLINGNNHAILLNGQIQSGMALERSLCCVPVDYEDLEVAEMNEEGTTISIKPNMVAKECGCR